MMGSTKNGKISIKEYDQFCVGADLSPNYHPAFVEYYFTRLGKKPHIVGVFDKKDNLVAAFPSLLRQVFPNSLHARLLGDKFSKTCFIGQPESLFPIIPSAPMMRLKHLSPTTSPLLYGRIKSVGRYSLKSISIAKAGKHKRETRHQRTFFENGGTVIFTDTLESSIFSEIFLQLFCKRWNYYTKDFTFVRDQIISLYDHIFGIVLFMRDEPVAAQLCYKTTGGTMHYVDFINSGVKVEQNTRYGNIMMLTLLRRLEGDAAKIGKALRCSLGYYYGDHTYKAIWADPVSTYISL
jgi:hypothetical protein